MVTSKLMTHMAKNIPDEHLATDGRETDHHITVKYGLHTDDARDLQRVLDGEPPVRAKLGKTSLFETPEHDVLKIEVDSPDLHRLNAKVSKHLEHTDSFPDYVPHATLAYVKSGKGKNYSGQTTLEGHIVTIGTVYFSDKRGNKIPVSLNGDPVEAAIKRSVS